MLVYSLLIYTNCITVKVKNAGYLTRHSDVNVIPGLAEKVYKQYLS